MADRYQQFADSPPGRFMVRRLGLPQPTPLRRGPDLFDGPIRLGGATTHRELLTRLGFEITDTADAYAALIFDASRIERTGQLREVFDFFGPAMRALAPSGRLIVLGNAGLPTHPAQRALEGFVRSAAKELRAGATGQLVYVAPGAEGSLESTLRFLLSGRSAYVDGQVIRIGAGAAPAPEDWERPLAGKVALVTGAARGIGRSIAETLARDGAHVVCLDIPKMGDELAEVANEIGGETLQADITDAKAPQQIVDHLKQRHGGVDVFVHNAGITQDKTLGRMSEDQWDAVLGVNLISQERLTAALLDADALRRDGRIVCVASIGGIAGNRGQTNYGASKAGVIGLVEGLAPELAKRQVTINAVAPGFIETRMTAAMPVGTREAGRRMNSLSQGGQPVDVAETIAWLAGSGLDRNVIRVCGQSVLGC